MKNEMVDVMEMTLSFQKGQEKGFNYFFRTIYDQLVQYAFRMVNNLPTAEDIAVESFNKIWQRHSTFTHPYVIRKWLYTTTRNDCINHLQKRKQKMEREPGLIAHLESLSTSDLFEEKLKAEFYQLLYSGMETLPAECRNVFDAILKGLDSGDATRLGITNCKSTFKNQKIRGKKLILSYLNGERTIGRNKQYNIDLATGLDRKSPSYRRDREIFYSPLTDAEISVKFNLNIDVIKQIRKYKPKNNLRKRGGVVMRIGELLGDGLSVTQISKILDVSYWAVALQIKEYGLRKVIKPSKRNARLLATS